MTPARLARILFAVSLLIVAILIKAKFPGLWAGIDAWSEHATAKVVRGVGIASAVLLAIAIGLLLWDRFIRLRNRHGYDAQMGRGLTSGLLIFVLLVAIVLGVGAYFHSRLIVMGIGLCTIGLSMWLVGGLIVEAVKAMRKKRRTQT